MMAKDPAERFQTPAEIVAALEPTVRRTSKSVVRLTGILTLFFAVMATAVVFYLQTDYGVVRVDVADESLELPRGSCE